MSELRRFQASHPRILHSTSDRAQGCDVTALASAAAAGPIHVGQLAGEAGEDLEEMSRRATLGTMTMALLHEQASMVQGLQGALFELEDFVRAAAEAQGDSEVLDTLVQAVETSARMVALFRASKTFLRSSDATQRPCSIRALVERSIEASRLVMQDVELRVSELPEQELEVNEALFVQVLVNLLRNAAEASPPGGVVHIDVQVHGGEVVFSVRDQGEGVPEELVGTLFSPFKTSKDADSSTGLGLTIAAEIVSRYGGHIHYRAAEGAGALFSVHVPLVARARGLKLVAQ